MTYPKPIMTRTELVDLGYKEAFLMQAFADPTQDFAWRANPNHPKSAILYDTEKFEAWKNKNIAVQKRAIPRGRRFVTREELEARLKA